MTKVLITRSDGLPRVTCDQCAALHPNATRERVRGHVKKTGHTVTVVVEDTTRYEPEPVR